MEEENNDNNLDVIELDEIPLDDIPILDVDFDSLEENDAQEKPDLAREKNIESINNWYTEGRKLFIVDNFSLASEKLSAAAELAARVYGEFAPECFNVHLYYGKTLIELARQEFQVVNMKNGDEDESSTSESEGEKEEEKEENKNSDDEEEEKASTHDSIDLNEAPETKEANDQTLEPVQPLPDDDEDPTLIQMAWEVLEVARAISEKHEKTPEWELNKAEVLVTLGDASILDEKYKQAMEDIQTAIGIMKQYLPEHDRKIAEAYFQLGRAHNFADEFDKAAEAFNQAVSVFEKRSAFLESELQTADESKKSTLKQDLDDVKNLIPEMKSQVQDALESAEAFKQKQNAGFDLKASAKKGVLESPEEAAEKPTSDLTFLVRRKRPAGNSIEEPKSKKSDDLNE